MSIFTRWERFDADAYDRVIGEARGDAWAWRMMRARRAKPTPLPVAGMFQTKLWHALHVALTGETDGGEPPASYVVWTSAEPLEASFGQAHFIHSRADTQLIANYLSTTHLDGVIANLYAAAELGIAMYWVRGRDAAREIVSSGAFADAYFGVRELYRAAAAHDQVVVVGRS